MSVDIAAQLASQIEDRIKLSAINNVALPPGTNDA
jgi:hypothetical protein